MTNQQIIDGNKLIAEFMGAQIKGDSVFFIEHPAYYIKDGSGFLAYEDELFYRERFDWLMPVVEKIESLEYKVNIERYGTIIRHSAEHAPFYILRTDISECSIINPKKIEHTYSAVIQFIQWYNTNQQKQ